MSKQLFKDSWINMKKSKPLKEDRGENLIIAWAKDVSEPRVISINLLYATLGLSEETRPHNYTHWMKYYAPKRKRKKIRRS